MNISPSYVAITYKEVDPVNVFVLVAMFGGYFGYLTFLFSLFFSKHNTEENIEEEGFRMRTSSKAERSSLLQKSIGGDSDVKDIKMKV